MKLIIAIFLFMLGCSTNQTAIKPKMHLPPLTIKQQKPKDKIQQSNFQLSHKRELQYLTRETNDTINWLKLDPAVIKAAQEDKLFLIYIKNSDCEDCLALEYLTFKDLKIVEIINKEYVPVILETETDKFQLASANINQYPSIIIDAPSGDTIMTIEGFISNDMLYAILEKAHVVWRESSTTSGPNLDIFRDAISVDED